MNELKQLQGGLVVSCQPVENGPMDRPDIILAMAQAAIAGGAVGVRVEGADNVAAVRAGLCFPIIGIVKRDLSDSPVRITPWVQDVVDLAKAGADVIAYDATDRVRPISAAEILGTILSHNCLAMADCATFADASAAATGGAQILGSTLSGYTAETETDSRGPDLKLVSDLRQLNRFVMAEGRYDTPQMARMALEAGADCVTVGTVLTRLEVNTAKFHEALRTRDDENGDTHSD
ncbi:N-acetylmannosamine-6-phosphate 2-epimerase [Shimia sagamensis]|uniref:Putative N-acetylmannosamine-6-phosphate 2-epimerase n=1 Tax=Shimia sagamensis TaxID=1566352 RepID=A0ABY1NAB5_9RHOB|nr:putative N-acetylmannosamine-6-phosphate 2-epimerase [Shimia sagamensis]SMP04575.1 N-acylglucosamine-6-phosphate 2-epimerase [Shimia sagamensis]